MTVSDPDTGGGSRNITATGLATQWTPNAGSAYAVTIVPNTCSPSNAPAADVCFVPGSAAPTANQTCTITNPNNGPAFSGTMPNSALTADISCTTNKFTLGGYVTGLDAANFNILHVGSGQPSGSQSTPISGNDGYAFANPVTSGTEFARIADDRDPAIKPSRSRRRAVRSLLFLPSTRHPHTTTPSSPTSTRPESSSRSSSSKPA